MKPLRATLRFCTVCNKVRRCYHTFYEGGWEERCGMCGTWKVLMHTPDGTPAEAAWWLPD